MAIVAYNTNLTLKECLNKKCTQSCPMGALKEV